MKRVHLSARATGAATERAAVTAVTAADVTTAASQAGRLAAGALLLLAAVGTAGAHQALGPFARPAGAQVASDDPWTSVRAAARADDPWTSAPAGPLRDDPWT
ncbi:hypothetical protein ABZT08_08040 [Streptomyces sp. NPDC005526]|uniref:hypothetical protein n=1 Tax=Streptomyces sp. NPDC005526 TaxID=3156885 RepID=UPI0033B23AA5